MEDRRSRERYPIKCLVDIVTSEVTIKGETQNISGEGAFILCDQPRQPEEKVTLAIEFPDGFIMDTLAEVVWSSAPESSDESMPQGMGVRFLW